MSLQTCLNIYLDLTLDGLLSLHHLKWDNALEAPLFSTCVTEITMRMATREKIVSLAIFLFLHPSKTKRLVSPEQKKKLLSSEERIKARQSIDRFPTTQHSNLRLAFTGNHQLLRYFQKGRECHNVDMYLMGHAHCSTPQAMNICTELEF